jgi:hypothetical protein
MLNAERRIDNDERYRMMVIEYMEGGRIDLVISQPCRRANRTDSLMFHLLNGKESYCCVAAAAAAAAVEVPFFWCKLGPSIHILH